MRLRHAQGGKSIADLVSSLQDKLSATLRAKIVKNVFSAIGSAISEASEIRYDEAFAAANLRVIAANLIPVVVIPDGSPISSVRFRVNLDDSSLTSYMLSTASHLALSARSDKEFSIDA